MQIFYHDSNFSAMNDRYFRLSLLHCSNIVSTWKLTWQRDRKRLYVAWGFYFGNEGSPRSVVKKKPPVTLWEHKRSNGLIWCYCRHRILNLANNRPKTLIHQLFCVIDYVKCSGNYCFLINIHTYYVLFNFKLCQRKYNRKYFLISLLISPLPIKHFENTFIFVTKKNLHWDS